jgi:hypothetical protein
MFKSKNLNSQILKHQEDAEINGNNFASLIKECFNVHEASIDPEGNIWIANPCTGHWLRDFEKEKLINWLESF